MACFFLPCHTKLVPRTDFGKEVAKTDPPDQFWLSKSIPLAKNSPQGDEIWQTYMYACQNQSPCKTESLYQCSACMHVDKAQASYT